ncbi:hypothetical protein [Paenibacillus sp. y28]|uniref:hypothetical protein n=1 Tax=Paenibacillus sp. y28 TaxID=3129110 RepID=UPI003015D53A
MSLPENTYSGMFLEDLTDKLTDTFVTVADHMNTAIDLQAVELKKHRSGWKGTLYLNSGSKRTRSFYLA